MQVQVVGWQCAQVQVHNVEAQGLEQFVLRGGKVRVATPGEGVHDVEAQGLVQFVLQDGEVEVATPGDGLRGSPVCLVQGPSRVSREPLVVDGVEEQA